MAWSFEDITAAVRYADTVFRFVFGDTLNPLKNFDRTEKGFIFGFTQHFSTCWINFSSGKKTNIFSLSLQSVKMCEQGMNGILLFLYLFMKACIFCDFGFSVLLTFDVWPQDSTMIYMYKYIWCIIWSQNTCFNSNNGELTLDNSTQTILQMQHFLHFNSIKWFNILLKLSRVQQEHELKHFYNIWRKLYICCPDQPENYSSVKLNWKKGFNFFIMNPFIEW